MAWNDSGGSNGKDHDPWSGKKKPQTPADLDKIFSNFQKKISQMLSGEEPTNSYNGPGNNSFSANPQLILTMLLLALFFIWFLFGLYIVKPAEQAVVLRFGKYIDTLGPGPHWSPPFIEQVFKVNEQEIEHYSYTADMLTKDENIVTVAVAVQYRKADARAFLFNVVNPVESLQQATASALRQVIGNTTLDQVLTSGREKVRQEVKTQMSILMDKYETGIQITDVALQPAKAPEAVKDAFDDAIKAQEDEQRYINQAQAYTMQVIPQAEGQAKRLMANAQAYRQQVVLNARGEVSRFLALLPEYQKTPNITRERLYLAGLETMLSNVTKIFVDLPKSSNNVIYLPVDKMIPAQVPSSKTAKPVQIFSPAPTPESTENTPQNPDLDNSTNSSYLSMANKMNYLGRNAQ